MSSYGLFLEHLLPMDKFTRIVSFLLLVASGIVFLQHRRMEHLVDERDRYRRNNTALLSEVERLQLDSATMALDVKTLHLTIDEYKRFRAEDAATIEHLGIKIRNLQATARHELAVLAPLDATVRDTLVVRDTVPVAIQKIEMKTPHIQLTGIITHNRFQGELRVPISLHQVVWIEYKRRWLFWKRVKAVHQTIVSDNPFVEIEYSEYITVGHNK